jgi:hypothetical protein
MKISLLVLSALALSATAALAADPPQSTGSRGACKADAATLCPGVQPGGGRITACLKQNEAKVSSACKDAMAKAHDKKAPASSASSSGSGK